MLILYCFEKIKQDLLCQVPGIQLVLNSVAAVIIVIIVGDFQKRIQFIIFYIPINIHGLCISCVTEIIIYVSIAFLFL
jgi:hypothetical protein